MLAGNLASHPNTEATAEAHPTFTDYAFNSLVKLPAGRWLLSVIKGDGWLFMNQANVILYTNEQLEIDNQQEHMSIRSLYNRGFVRYKLQRLA